MDGKVIYVTPCIFTKWLSIENIQGCVKMTSLTMATQDSGGSASPSPGA
jgi:hypothetical protein